MKDEYQTIIIGGGVAGMTAALYLKRAGHSVAILEKEAPGGQITRTSEIENYPGILKIDGPELAFKMYEQVTTLEVPFIFQEVISLKLENDSILIDTKDHQFQCQNLILALGRNPKRLGIENEQKLSGKGISWCAVCDGPLYKNKEVAVIGGGRSAIEEALYLSKMCAKVTLIHRRDEFRAENTLVDELRNASNINLLTPNQVLKFIEKEGRLYSLILEDGSELKVDGCFEFIGQEPSTKIIQNLDILDSEGYIEVNKNYQTKYPNIYAGGDCIKKDLYQIVTACADSARIAEQILKK